MISKEFLNVGLELSPVYDLVEDLDSTLRFICYLTRLTSAYFFLIS